MTVNNEILVTWNKRRRRRTKDWHHDWKAHNHICGFCYLLSYTKYVVGVGDNNCVILLNKEKRLYLRIGSIIGSQV